MTGASALRGHDAEITGAAMISRDAAGLLMRQGIGAIAVSAATSSFLSFIVIDKEPRQQIIGWWLVMISGLAVRLFDVYLFHRRCASPSWNGQREILRFGCGVALSATIWLAFPLLFFSSLDQIGRTSMTIVLSGMAGGSATVLAASLPLSIGFCATLLLPTAIMFLGAGGVENHVLGTLGCLFFVVMAFSSRVSHISTMTSIRLSRKNEELRNLADERNAELKTAQFALRQSNSSLESRIKARTIDLEREIVEKERYAQDLSRIASTDSLTGLYNRAMISDRLVYTLAEAKESGDFVAVLFIDLDKFKEVNDVKGHHTGDRVLQIAAKRLSTSVKAGTDLARWGGDEFVVVLPAFADPIEAIRLAESLRDSLARPIKIDLETIVIGASIGIALFPDHGTQPDELICAADVAMYAGKEEKRGSVRMFNPGLAEDLVERHELEQALREAIVNDSLSLVFQPIVDASTKRCESLEALLRWNHPTLGPISPARFIPIAERSGEIVAIGNWVLRQACRAAASWPDEQQLAVSVNVSAAQILSGDVVEDVLAELVRSGLPAHRLHIELTESLFVSDHGRVVTTLRRLREEGVQISLDDFGTGFSSLAYLQNLPIDVVKIDQSFVRAMREDSHAVVDAIVSIARALDFRVIAEGVESPAQAAILLDLGVDYFQGYLYSPPLAASSVPQWLTEQERICAIISDCKLISA